MRHRFLASSLLVALLTPAGARAAESAETHLIAAKGLFEGFEYERALDELARARRLSTSLGESVVIALFEGVLLIELGHGPDAETAFVNALLLDPDAALPVKVSPKVSTVFEACRVRAKKRLAIDTELVRRVRSAIERSLPQPVEPGLPVLSIGCVAAGVVSAGLGGFFGMRSRSETWAAQTAYFGSDVGQHLSSARTTAIAANVLFAVAGVAVVTAVITWLFDLGRAAPAGSAGP